MSTDTARRYKEIIAARNAAGDRLRRYELRRADELAAELVAAEERLRAAAAKRERVRKSLEGWWREAEQLLHGTRWVSVGPMPRAREGAAGDAHRHAGGVAAAYDRLRRALRVLPGRPLREPRS